MRKPDDCSLTQAQRAKVRAEAERALREAGALGVFPTPVADIMSVAKVEEVKEDVLNESFIQKLRAKAHEAGQSLKTALSKVLGLFHASEGLVFIDKSLMGVKKTFVRLHESAHGFLPWQRTMYAVVEDCEHSLDPDVAEAFDREANVFASEVLFQIDTFIEEAESKAFGIFTAVDMSKKYGASLYASIRQYVSKSTKTCVVLVLNPPKFADGDGFRASLRRVVPSASFAQVFGNLDWPDAFTPDDKIGAMVPLGKSRASGKRNLKLTDANGVSHECVAESFTNTYQVFILIHAMDTMTATTIILPSSYGRP